MGKTSRKQAEFMTADEFLAWEGDGTGRRFELVDGVLRAMAPAAVNHGVIQGQLAYLLKRHIIEHKLPCAVIVAPGVQPRVHANANVRIPDIAVSCARLTAGLKTLPEPLLLIEIVSPSNRAQTWTNVWTYTTIVSARELLIVDSIRRDVKLLRRQADGAWPDQPEPIVADGVLTLDSLGMAVPIADIYEGAALS